MRLYRRNAASAVALEFSEDFALGLDLFSKTKALVPRVQEAHDLLDAAMKDADAKRRPYRRAMKERRVSELLLERAIDAVAARCKGLDAQNATALAAVVFPNGLEIEKQARGESQLRDTRALRKRIADSKQADVVAAAAELLAILDPALAAFEGKVAAWRDARTAQREAADLEDQRLTEHRQVMDATFGGVRSAYPGDTRLHNVIAPEVEDAGSAAPPEVAPADASAPPETTS